jgi:hypothetical protein
MKTSFWSGIPLFACLFEILMDESSDSGILSFFFFFFFAVLGFELRAYTLSHSTSTFLWWVFWDRVSRTICPGWDPPDLCLLVARITGVSYQRSALNQSFFPISCAVWGLQWTPSLEETIVDLVSAWATLEFGWGNDWRGGQTDTQAEEGNRQRTSRSSQELLVDSSCLARVSGGQAHLFIPWTFQERHVKCLPFPQASLICRHDRWHCSQLYPFLLEAAGLQVNRPEAHGWLHQNDLTW